MSLTHTSSNPPFRQVLDEILQQSSLMDSYRRDEAREMEKEMADSTDTAEWRSDNPVANCADDGCSDCEDENCPCRCHTNCERWELPEREYEGN